MGTEESEFGWIDLEKPFLVLADAPISPKRKKTLVTTLFLVNPTEADLENTRIDTGGHFSDDSEGVVEASGTSKRFGRLGARSASPIEQPDWDELYEFVIWWEIRYDDMDEALHFSLNHGRDGVVIVDVPILGGSGKLIKRWR